MNPKHAIWGTLGLMLLVVTLVAPRMGQFEKQKRTEAYLREAYHLAYELLRFESKHDRFPDDQAELETVFHNVSESASRWTFINDGSGKPRLYRRVDDQMQDYWIVFKQREQYTFILEARVENHLPFWNSGIVPNFGPTKAIQYFPEAAMSCSGCY